MFVRERKRRETAERVREGWEVGGGGRWCGDVTISPCLYGPTEVLLFFNLFVCHRDTFRVLLVCSLVGESDGRDRERTIRGGGVGGGGRSYYVALFV